MVNIKDVAIKAKVSVATVSRVTNNSGPVKEETRQKVLDAIKDLSYIPNPMAQGLVKQTSRSIGLVVPTITIPYFAQIAKGVEQVANSRGYTLYVCTTDYSPLVEENHIKQLILHSVDGVIIASGAENQQSKSSLLDVGKAVVFINREWDCPRVDSVYSDNVEGAQLVVNYLADMGHSRIGLLVEEIDTDENRNKLEGIFPVARQRNLKISPDSIIKCPNNMAGGFEGAKKLFNQQNPTAIIAFSDSLAVGAIHAVKNLNFKVPEQISFVGFNNTELATFFDPPLTSVDVMPKQLGELACKRLFVQLQSKRKLPVAKKKIPVKLIVRSSCKELLGGDGIK